MEVGMDRKFISIDLYCIQQLYGRRKLATYNTLSYVNDELETNLL